MRRDKRKKRRNTNLIAHFALIVLMALVVPVSINFLAGNFHLLRRTGERAAMLAVAINMPDAGLDLLQERFHDQLYGGDAPAGEDADHYGRPWIIPVPGPGAETARPETDEPDPAGGNSATPPRIPSQYQATLLSENFHGSVSSANLVRFGAAYIRNETSVDNETVESILETPMQIVFEDTAEPQVLILHTHATESFERYDNDVYDTRNTWRSTDNNANMVAVGDAFAQVLEQNGIGVIHDDTQHDYPSYNGSYERSARTVQDYLDEYPSIKVVLDLHRDAMERENGTIVKPVTVVDGRKAAQVMIIAACDDDGSLGVPEWRQNLRFAALLADYMENTAPELTRPVYFCYRKYNMDLSTGALLLEFGSNANTLDEAVHAATLAGQALADLILDHTA